MRLRTAILIGALAALFVGTYRAIHAQVYTGADAVRGVNGTYPSDSGRSWSTYGTKTDTSNLQLQAAAGANLRVYVYGATCVNSSASTAAVALIKYSTTTMTAIECPPAGKGNYVYFDPPLGFPANTAVTMNSPGSVTTLYFTAWGTTAR